MRILRLAIRSIGVRLNGTVKIDLKMNDEQRPISTKNQSLAFLSRIRTGDQVIALKGQSPIWIHSKRDSIYRTDNTPYEQSMTFCGVIGDGIFTFWSSKRWLSSSFDTDLRTLLSRGVHVKYS